MTEPFHHCACVPCSRSLPTRSTLVAGPAYYNKQASKQATTTSLDSRAFHAERVANGVRPLPAPVPHALRPLPVTGKTPLPHPQTLPSGCTTVPPMARTPPLDRLRCRRVLPRPFWERKTVPDGPVHNADLSRNTVTRAAHEAKKEVFSFEKVRARSQLF